MRIFAFRLLAVFLGLLLFAVVLELGMRSTGKLITEAQKLSNHVAQFNDPNEIRIVVLGESTSAQFFAEGREESWVGQLETRLNQKYPGKTFKIFNLAVPAIVTDDLLFNYFSSYDMIRPHLTISMMGINDAVKLQRETAPDLKITKLFLSLRATVQHHAVAESCRNFEVDYAMIAKVVQQIESPNGDVAALFESYRKVSPEKQYELNRNFALAHMTSAQNKKSTKFCYGCVPRRPQLLQTSFDFLNRAAEICPAGAGLLRSLLVISQFLPQKKSEVAAIFQRSLNGGYEPSEFEIEWALRFVDTSDPDNFITQFAIERGFSLTGARSIDLVRSNHKKLADFIFERNGRYAAMSYPTARVSSVTQMFSDSQFEGKWFFSDLLYDAGDVAPVVGRYSGVYFVSNENFNGKVSAENFSEYFTDKFCAYLGCRFGHTTSKGYALIAANVEEQLSEVIHKIVFP